MIHKSSNYNTSGNRLLFYISLLISLSLPIIYFATDYKIIPIIGILFIFLLGIVCLTIISYTGKIEYIFTFGILFSSFYGFSSFPGNFYLEQYNYPLLAFLYFCLLVVRSHEDVQKYVISKPSRFDKFCLILFLCLFSISILINNQDLIKIEGISKIMLLILSGYLFAYYVPSILLNDEKVFYFFLKLLVYFGIATGLFGLVTVFNQSINIYNIYPGTAISFFKHPNATSSIYNFTVPPALYFLFFKRKEISFAEKIIFIGGIAIMVVGVLLTFSRMGIISIGIIFLIMSFNYSKKIFWTTLILIPVAGVFILSGFLTSKGTATLFGRVGLLATTIEMFRSSWFNSLWGFGTISTMKIFHDIKVSLNVSDENNVPHNIFVYFILQFGLITAIPLYFYIFKVILRTMKKILTSNYSPIITLSAAICLPLILKNLAEDLLFFPEFILYNLFLIFFGIMIILANNKHFSKYPGF